MRGNITLQPGVVQDNLGRLTKLRDGPRTARNCTSDALSHSQTASLPHRIAWNASKHPSRVFLLDGRLHRNPVQLRVSNRLCDKNPQGTD